MRQLETYLLRSKSELRTLGQVKYHSRKCAVNLPSSHSNIGSASWFLSLWDDVLPRHQLEFRSHIQEKLGFQKGDFFINVWIFSECPVIFYLKSILQPLVDRRFQPHPNPIGDPMYQALGVLHQPSFSNNEYRDFISIVYDKYIDFGNPLLRARLSTSTKLSTLSDLLTKLQGLNKCVAI
jgi:hypothetical protein